MKSLIPLFPFVAFLGLIACQGDDGPVAEGAAPGAEVVGDDTASGLATDANANANANAAAAEAVDRAALPASADGMAWASAGERSASFGPRGARALLSFACRDGGLRVTRLHPATPGSSATLSFTGGGHASSLPMRAVARPGGPGESEWQGEVRGDMARAVARPFGKGGEVEVTLGGAPALMVPTSPVVAAVFKHCAA